MAETRDASRLAVRTLAFKFLALGSFITFAACSLVLDLNTEQCRSTADCIAFGTGYECVTGSCTLPSTSVRPEAGGGDALPPECTTNQECIDRNFGEPYRCEVGKCLKLKSDTCNFVYPTGEFAKDNTIVMGTFIPLKGQIGPLSAPLAQAYMLALDEIKKAGGLPGGTSSPRRDLAFIFCDSTADLVESGVRHLAETVKVPAIVANFSQTNMTTFFTDILKPAGVFTLNPNDTTEALKAVPTNRLLWHLLGTPEDVALAYRPLVQRVETHVRARLSLADETRVAIVTSSSPTEESMLEVLREASTKGIVFNGKNTTANGANFLSIKIPSLETQPTATFGTHLTQLTSFKPHIVIFLTTGLELEKFVPALDSALKTAGEALPTYVLSVRNASAHMVLTYIGDNVVEPSDDKRKRFFGVQYAGAKVKDQYQLYLSRFGEQNPAADPRGYRALENHYDAIYWLAYGLYAAGPDAPLRGSSVADGVRKLLSGPPVHPGSVANITQAFISLSSSTTGVTYEGAMGTPDFDVASGAARSVGAVYCYAREGAQPTDPFGPKYDTLRYNRTSGQLEDGESFCFGGF